MQKSALSVAHEQRPVRARVEAQWATARVEHGGDLFGVDVDAQNLAGIDTGVDASICAENNVFGAAP